MTDGPRPRIEETQAKAGELTKGWLARCGFPAGCSVIDTAIVETANGHLQLWAINVVRDGIASRWL
jgi:hypothetical protein